MNHGSPSTVNQYFVEVIDRTSIAYGERAPPCRVCATHCDP
jgi:hypothetical protein